MRSIDVDPLPQAVRMAGLETSLGVEFWKRIEGGIELGVEDCDVIIGRTRTGEASAKVGQAVKAAKEKRLGSGIYTRYEITAEPTVVEEIAQLLGVDREEI